MSLTEAVALQSLSLKPCGLFQLVGRMIYSLVRLSGHGDVNILNRMLAMEQVCDKPFIRRPGLDRNDDWRWDEVLREAVRHDQGPSTS